MADPHLPKVISAFATATRHLDDTEPQIRDLIERHLMVPTALKGVKIGSAKQRREQLVAQITTIRSEAMKKAFRHLRDNLPSPNGL